LKEKESHDQRICAARDWLAMTIKVAVSNLHMAKSTFLLGAVGLALLCTCSTVNGAEAESTGAGQVIPISQELCSDMIAHHVLNPRAPVGCERLRLIKFGYIGFDSQLHDDGEIVVMDAVADYVLQIFVELRKASFPIAKAKLMSAYDGDDDASMADNNTSAFNVREIAGGGSISLHAYGLAIDLNPVQNPYVKRSGATLTYSPVSGADYANRLNGRPGKRPRPGMAEAAINIFANNGFLIWGGYWNNPIDYQHFEVGRTLANKLVGSSPAKAGEIFARHVKRYRACRATGQGVARRSSCTRAEDQRSDSLDE
jgi:hypothetical protein